ncbi:MAG TPA: hypothetical protein VG167_19010 [Verrucomicrobiae bacterium]|nr:hypothetical protein [Verrucomicrobiae bacterium]
MTPVALAAILSLVEEAITNFPTIAADIKGIFSKANPTPADWQTLRAQVLAKGYKDYVPASALPSAPPPAP